MKLSENRPLAWAVLFVCVLVSIVLFGGLGLREDRQSVEEVFYTGVDDAYFSLNGYIDRRAAAAQKLAAMGFALLGDSDAGTLSLSTAVAAVQAADTPDEKLLANAGNGALCRRLYARISASEAGERDQKDARMLYADLTDAAGKMAATSTLPARRNSTASCIPSPPRSCAVCSKLRHWRIACNEKAMVGPSARATYAG